MADSHYEFSQSGNAGADLFEAIKELGKAWDKITRQRGILIQSKDVGQSGDDAFASIATRYGYVGADAAAQKAAAAASFGELDSAFGNADAAVTQFLNRHL